MQVYHHAPGSRRPQLFSSAVWAAVTFSHNFWNGFDRDAFLHGSMMKITEIWGDFHGFPEVSASFCQFLPVNPPNISPKIVPMVSPKNDGSTRGKNIVTSPTKVPKQAEITKKTSKGGIVQNSQTQKRTLWKHTHTISKTPGVFLKSFRHFLRFFSFLGPSWSTLIRRVKCLNKRRSKWAGPGLNACQAVTVQKTLYATCFKGDTWDLGDLPMMTNIFRTNLGDI